MLRESGVSPEALVGYLGHLAGLQEKADRAMPRDLVGGFAWERLPRGDVSLPSDIENVLSAL